MFETAIRQVTFLVYEGVQLLDVAGAAEVFSQANELGSSPTYDVRFVGPSREHISSAGLGLLVAPLGSAPRSADTLIVPGAPRNALHAVLSDRATLTWLARSSRRARRVASVCSGAFLLGAVGMLDGRRATTHWMALDDLASACPTTRVDRDALFVEDGRIFTSAGVSTGIDLALHLVSQDLGREAALAVARALVLHLVRPGGQSQFSGPLLLQSSGGALGDLIPWLEHRLDREITVPHMASAMGMTERSFHRRCVASYGMAPARLLTELRLERARALLEKGGTIATVAVHAGFRDTAAFAKAFAKRFGTPPARYRRAFSPDAMAHRITSNAGAAARRGRFLTRSIRSE